MIYQFPLLDMYPKQMKLCQKVKCTTKRMTVLFTIVKTKTG